MFSAWGGVEREKNKYMGVAYHFFVLTEFQIVNSY